jgi:nicotinate-nucleotide pyrophosphorylase (carboxylating)
MPQTATDLSAAPNATHTHPDIAAALNSLVSLALAEDLGHSDPTPDCDLTARWTLPPAAQAQAVIVARDQGIVSGLDVAGLVFDRLVSPRLGTTGQTDAVVFEPLLKEGDKVSPDTKLVRLSGPAAVLLSGERTALNFLQQLSGTATLTRAYVDAIEGTSARITDTRKTTPGQRLLQKRAVVSGGGVNHRLGLYDAVLIKENHAAACGGVAQAVQRVRKEALLEGKSGVRVMVEAETLAEAQALAALKPDRIMLDNMPTALLQQAVASIRQLAPDTQIEATGGITLATVRAIAETGVDLISIGALTHSAPALDLSLLFVDQVA